MADGNTPDPLGENAGPLEREVGAARRQANLLPDRGFPVGLAWAFYAAIVAVALLWRLWWDGQLPWSAPGTAPLPLLIRFAAGLGVGLLGVWLSRRWIDRSVRGKRLSEERKAFGIVVVVPGRKIAVFNGVVIITNLIGLSGLSHVLRCPLRLGIHDRLP